MLEFGVEVTTAELIALERALRGLDTDDARAAVAKAHRSPTVLTANEREAVLSALRAIVGDPAAADKWDGLARLAAKLEHEQETAVAEPPPARRTRSTKS